MKTVGRNRVWCVLVAVSIGCVAVAMAQERSNSGVDDGSLAGLTSELRQLRIAVEQLTRSQAQTQALGVSLTVQQDRILQVANRLDAAQRVLDEESRAAQSFASHLESLTDGLARATDPNHRAEMEAQLVMMKREQAMAAVREQQARSREVALSQALQVEESRWSDLIARLEGLLRETQ